MSELTIDELKRVVEEIEARQVNPDDVWTAGELQEIWGVTHYTVDKYINALIKTGKFEATWAKRSTRIPGLAVKRPAYRIKKND